MSIKFTFTKLPLNFYTSVSDVVAVSDLNEITGRLMDLVKKAHICRVAYPIHPPSYWFKLITWHDSVHPWRDTISLSSPLYFLQFLLV